MSEIKKVENKNEKFAFRFIVKYSCFVCKRKLGILVSKTAEVPETILEKEDETHFICADCIKSNKRE
jgi:hypothetical protein